MRVFLLISLFFSQLNLSSAQQIKGVVVDELGNPLSGASVVLRTNTTQQIYNFVTTDKVGLFLFSYPRDTSHYFELRISYIGFIDTVVALNKNQSESIKCVLRKDDNVLPEVLVNSAKTWVEGDTTFYNVDQFLEGDERKLKDLVSRIPNLEIDYLGRLKYKGLPVQKVLVEGEDIFSDKVNMMLQNFPVHAIKNLQVLENQTDNPLMKGFEPSSKVFLNLELKKDKLQATLGDAELGLDTESRYILNTVFFGLLKKVKFGAIANMASQGNGISTLGENEIKRQGYVQTDYWTMRVPNLYRIADLNHSYYIKNKYRDVQLKFNLPISKVVKSELEINGLSDKQSQSIYASNRFYSENELVNRNETQFNTYNPSLWNFSQKLTWLIGERSSLVVSAGFLTDRTSGGSERKIVQSGYVDSVWDVLKNRTRHLQLKSSYIKRISDKKMLAIDAGFVQNDISQFGNAYSIFFPEMFNIVNPALTNFVQPLNIEQDQYYFTSKLLNNTGGFNYASFIKLENTSASSYAQLKVQSIKEDIEYLKFNSELKHILAAVSISKNWKLGKVHYLLEIQPGISSVKNQDSSLHFERNVFVLEWKNAFQYFNKNRRRHSFYINVKSQQPPMHRWVLSFRPTGLYQYVQSVNLPENIVSSEIGYNGSISISKGHLINLSTNGIITYGTFANNIQVDKILQISKDSFIRKVNNQLSFSLNYSVPMKRSTTMNNLVGLIYADSWIRMNGGVSKVKNTFIISKITLTHNWRKKYYLKILASSTANFATVPVVNSKKIKSDVINYQLGSENKWLLNKHHQFLLYASWFTTNKTSFFYTDASWQFNISRIPFDFRLSVQNVTNEKKWVHGYDFGLVRSVQTMPLIPLNFMMQVRYTF